MPRFTPLSTKGYDFTPTDLAEMNRIYERICVGGLPVSSEVDVPWLVATGVLVGYNLGLRGDELIEFATRRLAPLN